MLRPLSSLAFTLLKLVNAIHTKPDAQRRDATIDSAARCLEAVLQATSLILRAACANSSASSTGSHRRGSSSNSPAAAVISMLARSSAHKPGSLSEEHLLAISNSTGKPAGPNSGSSSTDAVSMVPWLVSLGRSCLVYSLVLQGSFAKAAGTSAGQRAQGSAAAMSRAFLSVSAVLPGWLQSSTVAGQLAAAGYVTDSVVELRQSASTAQQPVAQRAQPCWRSCCRGWGWR